MSIFDWFMRKAPTRDRLTLQEIREVICDKSLPEVCDYWGGLGDKSKQFNALLAVNQRFYELAHLEPAEPDAQRALALKLAEATTSDIELYLQSNNDDAGLQAFRHAVSNIKSNSQLNLIGPLPA